MEQAPVSATMARSFSGFSSMGQGRIMLSLKGMLSWYAMKMGLCRASSRLTSRMLALE